MTVKSPLTVSDRFFIRVNQFLDCMIFMSDPSKYVIEGNKAYGLLWDKHKNDPDNPAIESDMNATENYIDQFKV